ncbi:ABC transporter ATP-binding protein [Lentilactobacillus hilgardii]|uniref:ATP-binding cassette domain-containing protein n=2 Tax=Lentilactobacillus hilgardii TaxID=1588 RepID=A0A6P1E0Q8_LENHI|nr:ABC transporter ATP-binding protein [Lentilactobacillus hilgardii]EEI72302.1 ABC transporter, ATP-binding protein [Lentilactobacillus hilgardii ATCC 27305]MCT3392994.1 ABC transporter ATP-binding protein [Lentilactobacillus hilgardii]QHB50866.1 ATP-binding cassette domain-containing protein [Lentilactobacillus hilgardii]RRG08290.1 MAG: ABC transporter ATP-binding protein [Lactobacillus sp.]
MASSKRQSAWSESIPVKEQIHIIGRLFHYAAPYKWYFYFSVFFAIAVSVVNILLPRIIQTFMDSHLVVGHPDFKVMWFFAGLYFFGMIMKAIMQFAQTYLYEMGAEYMLENTRRQLFSKLHRLGMRYFDQTPSGSILSRLTNDTMAFSNFWALFSSLVVTISAMISSFIAMLLADTTIALWLLIFMPFLAVTVWYYQRYSTRVYRRMRERLSLLNAKLAEGITGISVIQQFRQEKRVNHEFNDTNDQYFNTRRAMIRINSLLLNPIINLFYALGSVLVLGMFGVRGLHGYVAAGVIYAFVTYLDNFYNPMSNMMDRLSDFQDGVVAGSRVLRIMDDQTMEPQQHSVEGATIAQGKIEFRHVTFAYDGQNPVLHDISFVAEPGQTIALVGETGSGKTSIINILMRFYEFGSGEILIDDRDIRDYTIKELREKMGLVLQEPFMFYGTVSSNIRMFNEHITDEEVRKAAHFVQADQFIEALPDQYEARVIERGASYSSGQRQLISFARTLVTDPKILILDEATANIDTETEQVIQKGLAKLQEGRTTIAIAHRLSTIQNADLILVLEKGRIVERGTNDELLKKRGYYYDMIKLQNSAHLD